LVALGAPEFRSQPPEVLFEETYVRRTRPSYDVASDGRFLMIQSANPEEGDTQIIVVLNWFEELKRLVSTN